MQDWLVIGAAALVVVVTWVALERAHEALGRPFTRAGERIRDRLFKPRAPR